jgi:hypothetical protein
MAGAETSDTAGGRFLYMKEGATRQYDLKLRHSGAYSGIHMRLKVHRKHGASAIVVSCHGDGEVSHGAHKKSFSLFYRRVYVVMGSLGEHGCSRIAITVRRMAFI